MAASGIQYTTSESNLQEQRGGFRNFIPEPKILPLFPVLSASFRNLQGISCFFRFLPPVSLLFRLFPDGFKPDIQAFSSLLKVQPSAATARVAA
jgi:hypothetical protein